MTRLLHLISAAFLFFCLILLPQGVAHADSVNAILYKAADTGNGDAVGTVTFSDSEDGLVIKTDLKGLPPGMRGFHVHEKPDCSPVSKDGKITHAGAAGGHYDPDNTGKHLGPGGGGHKGDLPALTVAEDGTAKVVMTLKGVKAEEFKNRALMIHAGGDNYSDEPEPLGGGGARIACGIIQ